MLALVFGAAGVLGSPSAKADETITYFAHDIQNTPVVAMDEAGDVLWRKTVRPFGLEDRVGGPEPALSGSARIGFTGHQKDVPTGLIYMQARDYDPALGIFYSPDPEDIDPESPFGPNRYIYADQNPYRYQDPSGRAPVLLVAAAAAYKLWSVSETVDDVINTAEMLADPNTTTEDIAFETAATVTGVVLGKIGGKVVEAGLKKVGKPLLEKAKKVAKGRTKGAKCAGGGCSSTVIGATPDLERPGVVGPNERVLDVKVGPTAKDTWKSNSGRLREAMNKGRPIRDASPGIDNREFLNAERALLRERGWELRDGFWHPPSN